MPGTPDSFGAAAAYVQPEHAATVDARWCLSRAITQLAQQGRGHSVRVEDRLFSPALIERWLNLINASVRWGW